MAKTTTRGRGPGSGTRSTMTAAVRAAAKRAERGQHGPGGEDAARQSEGRGTRQTLLAEAPEDGWDDPPEPSPESFEQDMELVEEDAPRPEAGGGSGVRRRVLVALLCLLSVAGLVAAGTLGWRYREGVRAEQARGQALAAAQQAAPVVLSYDYRHLDRDFARARTRLTGHFRDEYRKTTATVVAPTARKYHGVVTATVAAPAGGVPAASVVSASPDRAVVLLFVNQVTRSTQVSGSRVDLNRVRMTMTRTSGGWKVSAVDAL